MLSFCISLTMYKYRRVIQSEPFKYAAFLARKWSITGLILTIILVFFTGWTFMSVRNEVNSEQSVVDYIAAHLKVKVKAGDTMKSAFSVEITLSNTGHKRILFGQWRIHFYSVNAIRTQETAGFQVGWINGGLYFLSPIKHKFQGISSGKSVYIVIQGVKIIARSDIFPNWYVTSNANEITSPKIIESTKGESLSFVSPFKNSFQWKRHEFDSYNPYTPEERFMMNKAFQEISSKGGIQVIPTPFNVETVTGKSIVFDNTWVVIKQMSVDSDHVAASRILATKLGLIEVQKTKYGKYIKFETDRRFDKEQYQIKVESETRSVVITSASREGEFYGVQTLISMLEFSDIIPEVIINDQPRFKYRGLMLDVARNFHKKETIKKVIDVMSSYKLNKLHMHLTDDDGWRIEIPSIPELTKYGSRRCHNFENDRCINPNLGSGPFPDTSGSGFYSVSDFREILRYAKERFVQVIPEIDMPGHAFSAIRAMDLREQQKQRPHSLEKRSPYILTDDISGIKSMQGWAGNSLNPCLNSTYRFVENILTDVKLIYKGIHNLERVHLGGDEVMDGVWENSKTCQSLFHGLSLDHNAIKKMFLFTVADMAYKHDLNISLWQDGSYDIRKGPYNVSEFKQKEVYVNAWNNIWEMGNGGRPIEFADVGYKVILSLATHLYFDHPYEPDPEERGLQWATRYIDTFKVFGFIPMDVYANAEVDSVGNKINRDDLCKGPCPKTKSPNNFIGMEACVWTETIRNESQLLNMILPRLLAFAERAWHKAEWENVKETEKREHARSMDFKRFLNIVGKRDLPRLEKTGVSYRIPPPGLSFSVDNRVARFNTLYPGHKVMISLGNDRRWRSVDKELHIPIGVSDIHAYAVSPVSKTKSRTVSLHIKSGAEAVYLFISSTCTLSVLLIQLIVNI